MVEEVFPRLGEPVRAPPAARPGPAGLTRWAAGRARSSSGGSASPTAPSPTSRIDGGRRARSSAVGPDLAPGAGDATASTSTATCCCRRPPSPTPTSTRRSWPSASPTPPATCSGAIEAMEAGRAHAHGRRHRRPGRAGGPAAGGQRRHRHPVPRRHHVRSRAALASRAWSRPGDALADLVDLQIVALGELARHRDGGRRAPGPAAGRAGRRRRRRRRLPAPRRGPRGAPTRCCWRSPRRPAAASTSTPTRRSTPRCSACGTWPPGVTKSGFPHGVTASHCVSLGMQPVDVQRDSGRRRSRPPASASSRSPRPTCSCRAATPASATPRGLTAIRAAARRRRDRGRRGRQPPGPVQPGRPGRPAGDRRAPGDGRPPPARRGLRGGERAPAGPRSVCPTVARGAREPGRAAGRAGPDRPRGHRDRRRPTASSSTAGRVVSRSRVVTEP